MSLNKVISKAAREGHFTAQPLPIAKQKIEPGQYLLPIEKKREAAIFVPLGYEGEKPLPFALLLHGAGGDARHGVALLEIYAQNEKMILLAPKSRRQTWDVIADNYGEDVEFIDSALKYVFENCNVDASRIAVGGFSDGASYALSVGLTNGELFSHIIAFSPGFMAPTRQSDKPKIFISHGTEDRVLPIDRCSRRIVPQLKRAGYDVVYREFNGGHTIPPEITVDAVEWFLK